MSLLTLEKTNIATGSLTIGANYQVQGNTIFLGINFKEIQPGLGRTCCALFLMFLDF